MGLQTPRIRPEAMPVFRASFFEKDIEVLGPSSGDRGLKKRFSGFQKARKWTSSIFFDGVSELVSYPTKDVRETVRNPSILIHIPANAAVQWYASAQH